MPLMQSGFTNLSLKNELLNIMLIKGKSADAMYLENRNNDSRMNDMDMTDVKT